MSLRLRLALFYGTLTGLVVLMVGLLTYAVHSHEQYNSLDRALKGAAEHVADEYALGATSQEIGISLATPAEPSVVLRVYGPEGSLVAWSPHVASAPVVDPQVAVFQTSPPPYDPIVALAPSIPPVDAGRGTFGLATGPNGRRWRLYTLPTGSTVGFVVATAPLDWVDASVESFRARVPFLTVFGALVATIGGGLMAGRALRPVAKLTETAASIAHSRSFRRRVAVGTRRDELERLAATFNEMLASLEVAYRNQQRFVADASHELRAPLTAIQANLELLQRVPDMSPDDREEVVTEAVREAQRLTRLVADLLALARADAGVGLRREAVELDRILLQARSDARQLARDHTLEVGALEPMVIHGDPDRLKQLCLILLDNALKYTPPGGKVTLSLRNGGGWAQLAVQDTGAGIPPEDLPFVFERFYRADPARARDPGGSGLGLPIAKWIVDQHGGQISLASDPGKGTTATVVLPTAKTQPG